MPQSTQQLQLRSNILPIMLKCLEQSTQEMQGQSFSSKSTKHNQGVVLKRKRNKPYISYYRLLHPNPFHHVYKLFNSFGINQTALQNSDFQQSFFRTVFYHNVVTKVQKYKNAVVISLNTIQETLTQPTVDYFIDKLKADGNITSYEIATQVEQIRSLLGAISVQKKPVVLLEDNQSITKALNQFEGQMFIYKFALQKIAISNELLKFMGYDVEEFAVEAMKYKNVFIDFLTSSSYARIIIQAMKVIKLFLTADLSKISQQQFLEMTKLSFNDYIYSKDYKKRFCELQYFVMPKRAVCIRVKKVIYQTNDLKWRPYGGSRNGYQEQKKDLIRVENKLFNKLGVIPDNMLQDQCRKMAGYKTIAGNHKTLRNQ